MNTSDCKFMPTEADFVEWREMYSKFQMDPKRKIMETFHPLLEREARSLLMHYDDVSFYPRGINNYPKIPKKDNCCFQKTTGS